MPRTRKALVLALLLAFGVSARAEEPPAQRIKALNQQAAVLSAELAVENLRAQVAQKKAEGAKAEGGRSAPGGSAGPKELAELPIVTAIEKAGGSRIATLRYRNGSDRIVSEGAKADAWTVQKITSQEVWLANGRETARLSVGSDSGGYAPIGAGAAGTGTASLPAPPPAR